MNKYFLSSLCLLALNSAQADDAAPSLMLPAASVTAPEVEIESIDLKTATSAGSRLNLTGLETPASVESLTGAQIRARGGSLAPMELFKDFRGREPSIDALLRHSGLTEDAAA